jgi:uncharacterized coiled-coil protein SlyX
MNARERLTELERDFGAPDATMCLPDYLAKRAQLQRESEREASRPTPEAAPAPATAPPTTPRKPRMDAAKTAELARKRRLFDDAEARGDAEEMISAAEGMGELDGDEALDTCSEKFRKLQAWQVFGHVMQLAEHFTRLFKVHVARRKAIEKRIAGLEQRVADLQGLIDKGAVARESLERRASRHAEHLARLEDRVRKVEGK